MEAGLVENREVLEKKWLQQAQGLRAKAEGLPSGTSRNSLLKQAREIESLARANGWLHSSDLKPPVGR